MDLTHPHNQVEDATAPLREALRLGMGGACPESGYLFGRTPAFRMGSRYVITAGPAGRRCCCHRPAG